MMRSAIWIFVVVIGYLPQKNMADELHIATVTAFEETLLQLKPLFEQETGHTFTAAGDAGGTIYQQIKAGAAIDVFLAADTEYPNKLIEEDFAWADSLTIYALGRLVLWVKSPKSLLVNENILSDLDVIAIPDTEKTAYGRAVQQVLQKLNLWERLQAKIIIKKTTGEVYRQISNRQVNAGFISLSQYLSSAENLGTACWIVPQHLHQPIHHGAVIMRTTPHLEAAQALLEFLHHPKALKIIHDFGFRVPGFDKTDD